MTERHYFALVLLGTVVASVGVWNAGIPLSDEGVHVLEGMKILEGISSTNPYYLVYAGLFAWITPDPLVAHLILRFLVTTCSTVGLYFVLRSFRCVSPLATTLSCIIWAAAPLNNPYTQGGNINVFAICLVLPGLAYLLRTLSLRGLLVFLLGTFWAANVRPEYFAPFLLVPAGATIYFVFRQRLGVTDNVNLIGKQWGITAALSVALVASALVVAFPKTDDSVPRTGPSSLTFSDYLLMGLGQCYAVYYKDRHPDEQFEPMTEYKDILDKVFSKPRTFTEALRNNPSEAGHYFLQNGARNLARILRGELLVSNSRFGQRWPSEIVRLLVLLGAGIGIWMIARSRPRVLIGSLARDEFVRILVLLLLASASSVSILLLIPNARYWITWVPLAYLVLAWAVDHIIDFCRARHWEIFLLFAAIASFDFPVFVGMQSNQGMIYTVKESLSDLGREPVIAGLFVYPLATFAFNGKARQVNAYDKLSPDGLRDHRYDLFIADGLESTAIWNRDKLFFEAFVRSPESYGYRLLPSMPSGTRIYVRARHARANDHT